MSTDQEVLVSTFTSGLKSDLARASLEHGARITLVLVEGIDRGRKAWPNVHVTEETFARYLADLLNVADGDPWSTLEQMHLSDLYLVCGCLSGAPGAIPAFDKAFLAGVGRWSQRIDHTETSDEVRQILREKLFTSGGHRCAKLASYCGLGKLSNWVAIAAQREAIGLARREEARPRPTSLEDVEHVVATLADPERVYITSRYRAELRETLLEAVSGLSERDRLILRLNLVDGISLDRVARMYGVSQSTVSRWLAAARETIRNEVEKMWDERVGLSRDESLSLFALIDSDLDISLTTLLG